MNEYRFYVYITSNNKTIDSVFHSVFAKNYRSAYQTLISEFPCKYPCDGFYVSPRYRVNGKMRTAR